VRGKTRRAVSLEDGTEGSSLPSPADSLTYTLRLRLLPFVVLSDFPAVLCCRYLYVVEPGYLHFRREVEEERVSLAVGRPHLCPTLPCPHQLFYQESEPTIDLREAHRLALVEEKSDKFGPRLLIEIGSSTVRLRFNSAEDAEIWRAGLEQWKKYAEEHRESTLPPAFRALTPLSRSLWRSGAEGEEG
jgi:hypothetical protein